jgi:hypothetical protein
MPATTPGARAAIRGASSPPRLWPATQTWRASTAGAAAASCAAATASSTVSSATVYLRVTANSSGCAWVRFS